jgi:hypothetical protein
LLRELDRAPQEVQETFSSISLDLMERIEYSEEIAFLRDAYIETGVVGEKAKFDAEHIAAATVAEVDLVVSWNFKHIVHYEKISGYQAVNLLRGYKPIKIYSPKEVVGL